MSDEPRDDINEDAMNAIREAVEERQRSFSALDDGILDLDDIVWRSPIIDPTDTITRLAEEADKVARGLDDAPPQATVLRQRSAPDFGAQAPRRAAKNPALDDAEASIQALVTASLRERGKIGPDGKLAVSEDELRRLVRDQIDRWVAQHMNAPDQGGLQNDAEMRRNANRDSLNEQD